ncbi:WD40 repeat-like protein [Sporormia fimetaria CBS 119925]|uniref:WD40 repeat-like protein n=1 Tax=Sporormia fimetaria CBS 119925 TaxID=1340428 RepID=A0A6A6V0X4_9PLEO|nr:WD40 repeat-like protein [Sporormia fimetaria CBS 119925]
MNTRPVIDSSSGPYVLSVSFNADNSCFSVALDDGFRVYSAKSGDLQLARKIDGGIGLAEMLGTTNYLALANRGKPPHKSVKPDGPPGPSDWVYVDADRHQLCIWNETSQRVAVTLEFKTPILRVRITQTHLIVALLNSVSIYKMKIPLEKIEQYETVDNRFGICCLGKTVALFPGITPGQVKLYDLATKHMRIIPAHDTALRALTLSPKEDMVATASKKGTIIRVWSASDCTKVTEFRRGIDLATILSMALSPNGKMLAAASDKSTLHIFDLSSPKPDSQTHKWGVLAKVPMLPRYFSDAHPAISVKFEIGDEPSSRTLSRAMATGSIPPILPAGGPTKGLVGWVNDDTLLVLGAGYDARWERFRVGVNTDGHQVVYRDGWKRYLE